MSIFEWPLKTGLTVKQFFQPLLYMLKYDKILYALFKLSFIPIY